MTSPDAMYEARVKRAQELLQSVYHAAMATVNSDGSPHNTPYFFMHNGELTHLYWSSHPSSLHSQNIERTGQLFVVLYDATVRGGLYIQARNARVAEGKELDAALAAHNNARARAGRTPPIEREYYERGPQKLYAADITDMWVNVVEFDNQDRHVRDYRQQVTAEQLLA